MKDKEKTGNLFERLKHHLWFLLLLWTGCIAASLLWNLYEQREKVFKIVQNSAQITFENDVLYRRWAARQGGVYVPVSEHTPPNPYLAVPDRDITTSSGLSLTLVNPAYMARQVNQLAADIHGSHGHITSLNPIRPENGPDPWEAAALKSFEKGMKEVSSVEKIAGEQYMRLMRPFVAEKACLKCHASQGYKEGDIRGGISVSIPMAPAWAIERPLIAKISLAHLLLWLVGIAGIVISKKGLEKEIFAREKAEAVLSETANKHRIVADFTYNWESWRGPDDRFLYISPSCERITGYTREEFMQDPQLYSRMIHPDDRGHVTSLLREADSCQRPCELEFRIVRRDGQERWIGHACNSVLDANGQSLGRRASDRDITKRKYAEQGLQDRTLELQQLNETLERRVRERTAELANLSSELLVAQEKERRRISYDLHDNVWQTLEIIKSQLEHLFSRENEADWAAVHRKAKQLMPVIRDMIARVRSMQGDLWPSVLDDVGILATLEWYCREFGMNHPGLGIEKHVGLAEDEVPASAKIVIYRVMQEALSNVAKHSQASQVSLSLIKSDHRLEFLIKDNGMGFDPEEAIVKRSPWGGLGLLSMKERTELSGGLFGVETAKGKGTAIRVSWPLKDGC